MAEVYVDPFEFVEEAYEPNRETVDFLESFMEELFGSDSDESGRIQWLTSSLSSSLRPTKHLMTFLTLKRYCTVVFLDHAGGHIFVIEIWYHHDKSSIFVPPPEIAMFLKVFFFFF